MKYLNNLLIASQHIVEQDKNVNKFKCTILVQGSIEALLHFLVLELTVYFPYFLSPPQPPLHHHCMNTETQH